MDSRNEKEKGEDLKLMKDPASWARWPLLPVKKIPDDEERPEFGFLLATGKPVVYLENMFCLQDLGIVTIKDVMEKVEGKEYPTFEGIIGDGWIVD